MAGPIITAARERFRQNHPAVAAAVRAGLREAVDDPTTAIETVDAGTVAAVTAAVAPIVQNATNSEPWWKSRVWIGLLTAFVGVIAARLGIQFSANETAFINQAAPFLLEGLGLAVAGIGRAVGSRRGPIRWLRPWTLLGIGK